MRATGERDDTTTEASVADSATTAVTLTAGKEEAGERDGKGTRHRVGALRSAPSPSDQKQVQERQRGKAPEAGSSPESDSPETRAALAGLVATHCSQQQSMLAADSDLAWLEAWLATAGLLPPSAYRSSASSPSPPHDFMALFAEHGLTDPSAVAALTESDLDYLGIRALRWRKEVMGAVNRLRSELSDAAPVLSAAPIAGHREESDWRAQQREDEESEHAAFRAAVEAWRRSGSSAAAVAAASASEGSMWVNPFAVEPSMEAGQSVDAGVGCEAQGTCVAQVLASVEDAHRQWLAEQCRVHEHARAALRQLQDEDEDRRLRRAALLRTTLLDDGDDDDNVRDEDGVAGASGVHVEELVGPALTESLPAMPLEEEPPL